MARGTFKQKRGGGRNFSRNLVLDENGTAVSTDKPRPRRGKDNDDSEDDDDEEDEEEDEEDEDEDEEDEGTSAQAIKQPELSRAERKQLKKQGKANGQQEGDDEDEDQDPLFANPNIVVGKKLAISDLSAPRELTRREREQKEKKEAKERYWKLHTEGKTDEAKADLARLAKIRAEREAAQARRKAEAEAKAADLQAKMKK